MAETPRQPRSPAPLPYASLSVIGAGAWGTALASVAAAGGRPVLLWAREPDVVASIGSSGINQRFLPGIALHKGVEATSDLAKAASAEAIILAAPAQHLRASLKDLRPLLKAGTPIVLAAKGLETGTGKLVTEILQEGAPEAEIAILSGPSFAIDAARGLPTLVAVAAQGDIALRLQATLGGMPSFRPYATDDVTGVALGGAGKNVYAIACGMVEGAKMGESARAGLLARGFAELMRLGTALGARGETLMGLSGLGDLVLTATSMSSRNFAFGAALGSGKSPAEMLSPDKPLAEGAYTAPALVARGKAHGIEMPVAEAVADVLSGKLDIRAAGERLLSRPLKTE
jgi:glycerol-3-phosphate dehydrogenase (NAD(P)+)